MTGLTFLTLVLSVTGGAWGQSYRRWTCPSNGREIASAFICDGDNDCGDKADEKGCEGRGRWTCKNGKVINSAFICDGDNDCGDASDESISFCGVDFNCPNGENIQASRRCNGKKECSDGADEKGCQDPPHQINFAHQGTKIAPLNQGGCNTTIILAPSGPGGLLSALVGNNVFRNADGSDTDEHRTATRLTCSSGIWALDNVKALPRGVDPFLGEKPLFVCLNGRWVRGPHSSFLKELLIRKHGIHCLPTPKGKLSCANGRVIPARWRCDGDDDCKDGTDEKDCESADNDSD